MNYQFSLLNSCLYFLFLSDKNFVNQYPDLQTALDEELARVTRQYGGEKPEDLAKFPSVQLEGMFFIQHGSNFETF